MKIAFSPESMVPFHAGTLEEKPLGGMETAAIRLAGALASLGHDVTVFSDIENPPLSNPLYLPKKSLAHLGPVDLFIAIREWKGCFLPVRAKKILYWTGDSYDLIQNFGIGDRRIAGRISALLPVSEWHAQALCQASGFPPEKVYVLRNGIFADYFKGAEERRQKRLIYSSTPYRGLKFMPGIFKQLKEKHPELELHIFSDYKVYGDPPGPAYSALYQEFQLIKNEFAKLPGCFLHGNVRQKDLAREMMRSSILAYPNTFEETSCITIMEAQAAGCAVITSSLGALPETVGDAGIIVPGRPGTPEYLRAFTEQLDLLLSDEKATQELSAKALARSENSDWLKIARDFAAAFAV